MLRDNSISLRARGLLAMVLTHQEEWVITKSWITEQVKEGKQAVASTFRELERSGYAVMQEERNEVGKIVSRTWTFHDSPVPESDRSQATNRTSSSVSEGETHMPGTQHVAIRHVANQPLRIQWLKKTIRENTFLGRIRFRKSNHQRNERGIRTSMSWSGSVELTRKGLESVEAALPNALTN